MRHPIVFFTCGILLAGTAGAAEEWTPCAVHAPSRSAAAHPPAAMLDGDPSTWTRFEDATPGGRPVTCSFVLDLGRVGETVGLRLVAQPARWKTTSPATVSVFACEDAAGARTNAVLASGVALMPATCGASQFVSWPPRRARYYRVEVGDAGYAGIRLWGDYFDWGFAHTLRAWGHEPNGPDEARVVDIAEVRLLTGAPDDLPAWNAHPERAFPLSRLRRNWLLQDFGFDGFARAEATNPPAYYAACEARRRRRLAALAATCPQFVYVKHFTMSGDAELSGNAMTTDSTMAAHPRSWRPGGQLCLLTVKPNGSVAHEVLLDRPQGCIRDPDVSPDGRTVLFAMRASFSPADHELARQGRTGMRRRADEMFSPRGDDYHLYTLDLVSRRLRQLTFSDPAPCADYEGVWIQGGRRILFQSTRNRQIIPCHRTENANLYVCEADGSRIRRVGYDGGATLFPQELPDGRFVFTRYEYNDRNARLQQPLFQMNPDFTMETEYYGNNSTFPTSLIHFRPVPGAALLLGVVSGHHVAQKGKLALLDRSKGTQGDEGLLFTAGSDPDGRPGTVASRMARHPILLRARAAKDPVLDDFSMLVGDQWQNPYPLSETEWVTGYHPEGTVCGTKYAENPNFGIYWQNAQGERELLAYDPAIGCSQPVAVRPRASPRPRPDAGRPDEAWGTFYVKDVHHGPAMEGVARGTVKTLRVVAVESRPAFLHGGSMASLYDAAFAPFIAYEGDLSGEALGVPGSAWDVKHVLGEVAVDADGGCAFRAPSGNPLYFQLLDARGRCVQTMRSWTVLQPGEARSCVGCHESKMEAPPVLSAGARAVQDLRPVPGQPPHPLLARLGRHGRLGDVQAFMGVHAVRPLDPEAPVEGFSFRRCVQPILDRSCVRCHDGRARNRPDLTGREAEDRRMLFKKDGWKAKIDGRRRLTRAYVALTKAGWQTLFCNWYSSTGVSEMLPPYAQGSTRSVLMDYFDGRHKGVVVPEEDRRVVACWIDLGVPFVGSYCEATDWSDEDRRIYDYHQRCREAFARREMEEARRWAARGTLLPEMHRPQ